MEKRVLVALDYDIMVPTAYTFLARYLDAVNAAESTRYRCYYVSAPAEIDLCARASTRLRCHLSG